jgi:hypothetical protein
VPADLTVIRARIDALEPRDHPQAEVREQLRPWKRRADRNLADQHRSPACEGDG